LRALVIVLLVLTVLMLVPLGVDGGYNGRSLILGIRIGLFNIRILPRKEKKYKPPKHKKPKKQKKPSKIEEEEPEDKKPLDKKKLAALVKAALKVLGRLKRKLRVDYIRIHYTFASDDPFDTAMGFGASSAAIGAFLPLIDNAFVINERDIGTSFDFLTDKPRFDFWITMSIQIWEILYLAIVFGIDFLILRIKHRRKNRKGKE